MQSVHLQDSYWDYISVYSREQAIEDGVLVDVSSTAKEAGFKVPVAVTRAVWDEYIAWNEEDNEKQTYQDESGRLWDVLWMLFNAIKGGGHEPFLEYTLYYVPRDGRSHTAVEGTLVSIIGPGDYGEPVVTIVLPNED